MGSSPSSRIYSFIATFSFFVTDPRLEPFLNAANHANINSHSVGLPSTRTMIPHSRGHWAQGRVGSISLRRHIAATSVHDRHPTLDPADRKHRSADLKRYARAVFPANSDLQFGSPRNEAQCYVAPKSDQQLTCHRDDGDAADLA